MNTFSNRAIIGLTKVGNIYCPKTGEFPEYQEVAGTRYLNSLVVHVPPDDFSALNLVLIILSFLPKFILSWLVGAMERSMDNSSDGIIPSTLRQLNLGLRGLVYSTYYSELTNPDFKGKKPLDILEFQINRVVD
jgi:hypothetical protein